MKDLQWFWRIIVELQEILENQMCIHKIQDGQYVMYHTEWMAVRMEQMMWENMNKIGKVQRKMKDGKNEEWENFERKTEKKNITWYVCCSVLLKSALSLAK